MHRTLLALATLALLTAPAGAQVVYSNGTPRIAFGVGVGPFDPPASQPFTLTGPVSFAGIGFDVGDSPFGIGGGAFQYSYSVSVAGGGVLFSGTTSEAFKTQIGTLNSFNIFQTAINVGPQSLVAGDYVLRIGGVNESNDASRMLLSTTTGQPIAFQLLATTVTPAPEPAALALLATGLLGVFGTARRRRA